MYQTLGLVGGWSQSVTIYAVNGLKVYKNALNTNLTIPQPPCKAGLQIKSQLQNTLIVFLNLDARKLTIKIDNMILEQYYCTYLIEKLLPAGC